MRAGYDGTSSPLLRVHARVPLDYVRAFRDRFGPDGQRLMLADIEREAKTSGASAIELVMQDPTDPSLVTVLARGQMKSNPVATVMHVQPVEEPPSWPLSFSFDEKPLLEPGMLEDEARAIALALRIERNPRHLEGFSNTLDPYMPVAASLLRERAALLEPGSDVRSESGSVDLESVKRARTTLPDVGLPPDLTNLEIKRAASVLSQGEETNAFPMGVLHVAAKTLRKTRTRLRQDGRGREPIYVVDREAMLAAAPPTGNEAFVSSTAAQLALSMTKPKISGVAKLERASSLFEELKSGNVPPEDRMQLLLARAMLEKARSAIERRRWVEWYRKQA